MNTMVAARVPVEVKQKADGILNELGSNTTELINRAFDFVIKNRMLPGEQERDVRQETVVREVDAGMLEEIRASYEEMSLPLSETWGDCDFKAIRDELEEERYARFA